MNTVQLFTLDELKGLIREVVEEETSRYSKKPFMTINEASKYLGISKSTLYGYNNQHRISFYKNGKIIYYKKEDLENFVLNKNNRIKSQEEIEIEAETYLACRKL